MHGTIVASGSPKFILYTAILFSLAFEYLCMITEHYNICIPRASHGVFLNSYPI